MLVLSRKRREKIRLRIPAGPTRDVWLQILDIRGDKVRLGFEAAEEIDVDREEVAAAIDAEKVSAQPATAFVGDG